MGNKACVIAVQTDEPSYAAGSNVSGRVYVSITDPNGVPVHSLNICFRGEENVVIHYTSSERDEHRHSHHRNDHSEHSLSERDHYERDIRPIFNLDTPIHTAMNGRLSPGQYEFPFQVAVPQSSPSSMRFTNGQSNCQIRYCVQAYLSSDGRPLHITCFSNPFKQKTVVSSKAYMEIVGTQELNNCVNGPIDLPPDTQIVNKCCCINKGTMTLKSDLDNDALVPNQTYHLNYGIQSDSTVPVKHVRIVLEEHIEFRAQDKTEHSKVNLIQVYENVNIPGNNEANEELQPTIGNTRQVQLRIPRTACTSMSGRLIKVYHRLLVIAKTECCISNPESCIDVSVIGQSMEQMVHDAAPQPEPSAPFIDEEEDDIVVEAMVLPENWLPVKADVAYLPVATLISED